MRDICRKITKCPGHSATAPPTPCPWPPTASSAHASLGAPAPEGERGSPEAARCHTPPSRTGRTGPSPARGRRADVVPRGSGAAPALARRLDLGLASQRASAGRPAALLSRLVLRSVEQILANLGEELLDILVCLCGCLHIQDALACGVFLRSLRGHRSGGPQVALVSHQRYQGIRAGSGLLDPIPRAVVGLLGGDVEHHDGDGRAPHVHGRDGLVSLLARRVPNLKLHHRVRGAVHHLRHEGGADARLHVLVELALAEPVGKTGLPDGGIADDHHLEVELLH
mmetsp:Transcript_90209/g.234833  ORF Transcript_90209/g.234833 Transcript_90209/m.234833 type:complete len:283 (-) Transcript_90209:111-959(-)